MQMHIFLGQNAMILLSHGHMRTDGAALSRRDRVPLLRRFMAGSERRHCTASKKNVGRCQKCNLPWQWHRTVSSSGQIPFLTRKRRQQMAERLRGFHRRLMSKAAEQNVREGRQAVTCSQLLKSSGHVGRIGGPCRSMASRRLEY